jgi:hypothetical protein
MVENLSGRDALYKNPGASLRSFIIARCIRHENVELTGEMLNTAIICEEFSRSTKVLAYIVGRLQKEAETLNQRIVCLDEETRDNFVMFTLPLGEFSQVMKLSFDSFIMNQDPSSSIVDITCQHGINLKSSMIDLSELISDVISSLDAVTSLNAA